MEYITGLGLNAACATQPHRGCGMRTKVEVDEREKLGGKKLLAEFERPRQS
jgi:hypothetical protein